MPLLSDFRDREHWSFSSINQFLNICSLRWAFQRLYRVEPEFHAVALPFGSAFHRTLEWVALTWKEGKATPEAEARALFDEVWRRELTEAGPVKFDDDENVETYSVLGQDMAACFVKERDPDEQVVAVNQAFCVPLVDAAGVALEKPLVGETDCQVRKNGQSVIVDWKSAGRRWPKDKAAHDLQPTAYLYAAGQLGMGTETFRFDVVVKNKTPVLERHVTTRNPDQFGRLVACVKTIERMVAAEHFMPSEQSFFCAGCSFKGACRAWHRQKARVVSVAA